MRANDFITELFRVGKNWKWVFKGSEEVFAEFKIGDVEYLWSASASNFKLPKRWTIVFQNRSQDSWDKSFGMTGTGNSTEVMSTVVDITRQFIKEYGDKIEELKFSSDGVSRTSLYAKLIKRLLPNWKLNTKKEAGEVDFYLTKPSAYGIEEAVEPISEAISISHLEEPIKKTINSAIIESIGSLYDLKNSYLDLEDMFNDGNTSKLTNILSNKLQGKFIKHGIGDSISRHVKKLLDSELPDTEVNLQFAKLPSSVGGQAGGNDIDINDAFTKQLTDKTMDNLLGIVNDNYGEGELVGGLWFIVNSLKRGERDYKEYILDGTEKITAKIASTIVHEVVHVIQHDRQDKKGRSEHEYRSYLDPIFRNKGKKSKQSQKFIDLHNKSDFSVSSLSADERKKYLKMYIASPQEMASFSHELAIEMINDYNLPEAKTLDDFENTVKDIDAEGIIDYVNSKFLLYTTPPKNKREYTVFKRYVKLVYKELQEYIIKRKKYLQAAVQ